MEGHNPDPSPSLYAVRPASSSSMVDTDESLIVAVQESSKSSEKVNDKGLMEVTEVNEKEVNDQQRT
jgi:hypothetical protein